MELWVGALNLGFLYAFVAIGIYITFRIHDFPDITVDGTFTTGAAVTAVLVVAGVHPLLAVLASFLACAAAGSITALINTRLHVNSLLAGILVMTGLYSINLHIMGRSNIPLLSTPEFFHLLNRANPGIPYEIWTALCLTVIMAVSWMAVSFFFKTDFGLSMRASGNNPVMSRAAGINVDRVKIFGVAIANRLVGISGSLVAQYQGFADIGMGIGTVVTGLASVIIGESILKRHSIYAWIGSAVIGSVIFRFMIAIALYAGMDPVDLKLLTAIFVLITLIVTAKIARGAGRVKKKHLVTAAVAAAIVLGIFAGIRYANLITAIMPQKNVRLALFQFTDNVILDTCARGVLDGLRKSGVLEKENIVVDHKMAHGEFPTAQSIAQEMVSRNYDYIVTVSTISLQVTANHNKKIPHIFAAVTDPIKAGVATSFTNHPANLTGLATPQPVEATVRLMRKVFPGAKVIGMIWSPAEVNSEICTVMTRAAAKKHGFKVVEVQITGTQEIDQALRSILSSEPDIFFTSGDTTVSAVIPSVAQKLRQKKIPYVTNTPADIDSGVFMCLGADYYDVGLKAADIAVRIVRGEKPAAIPIVSYVPEQLTLNLSLAKEYGITIPDDITKKAVRVVR
ncbi:MAG: ABC transporter substrate binding protein [Syntrophorhabdaceae bacterium]|nr:ABC transporter substrate binding protein [Syntrophorhabdaceae bacterium]